MAKTIRYLATIICLLLSLSSSLALAGAFDLKEGVTPKWARYYAKMGRATGEFGKDAESLAVNYLGFRQMRGTFSYGGEFGFLYGDGDKIQTVSATIQIRPDWNLEAEPSLDLSFGTADLSSEKSPDKNGRGTVSSIGIGLDLIKGKFYSTSLGINQTFLRGDAPGAKSSSFQTVTFSLNFDLY